MAEFCKVCGSLVTGGSCSNKRCGNHIIGTEFASLKQTDYIQDMIEKLHEDDSQYDFRTMTYKEADKLIKQLEERLDLGD